MNKLQLDQALWACCLYNTVALSTLQYRVNVQQEAIEALRLKEQQEGSAVNTSGAATSGRHNPIDIICVDNNGGKFFPLTESSGWSVYTVPSLS